MSFSLYNIAFENSVNVLSSSIKLLISNHDMKNGVKQKKKKKSKPTTSVIPKVAKSIIF